jgi:DNA polymerase-3 subunit beta
MMVPMEISVPKKDFLRLVERCHGVADKKSAMPVLSNVLLQARGTTLTVSATDLYLSMSGTTSAEVVHPGAVALPAKDLLDRIKAMPDGAISLVVDNEAKVVMRAVGSHRRYTLHGLPGGEFPQLPTADSAPAQTFETTADALAKLIAGTQFSISTDTTRAHVNSALFETTNKVMRMVTTDGHRLSKSEIKRDGYASATMLIPQKGIQELYRLLSGAKNAPVTVTQSGVNAFFGLGDTTLSVKLVDAQFPPYQQVIPSSSDRNAQAPRGALADAIRAVSLAASDRTGGIKLTLVPKAIRVISESPESGAGYDEIPVDYDGPEVTVGFNARYILDTLGAIDTDEVTVGLSADLDPCVIRPANGADDIDYVGVVMPMRV